MQESRLSRTVGVISQASGAGLRAGFSGCVALCTALEVCAKVNAQRELEGYDSRRLMLHYVM